MVRSAARARYLKRGNGCAGSAYGVYNCISYDPATGDGVVVLTTGAEPVAERDGFCNVFNEVNEYIYDVLGENDIL